MYHDGAWMVCSMACRGLVKVYAGDDRCVTITIPRSIEYQVADRETDRSDRITGLNRVEGMVGRDCHRDITE